PALQVTPCPDVDAVRVVKRVNFENLRDAGDPGELAQRYDAEGAHALTFHHVPASVEQRDTAFDAPRRTDAQECAPITPRGSARRVSDGASTDSSLQVTTHGGRRGTGIDAVAWAVRAAELGVGEILLNSMDADGTTAGFDLEMLRAVRGEVHVPLIASGGAG